MALGRALLARRRRATPGKVAFWLAGMATALLWLVPFLWMIATSLKPEGQILRYPPEWLPQEVSGESYQRVLSFQVGRGVWTSLVGFLADRAAAGPAGDRGAGDPALHGQLEQPLLAADRDVERRRQDRAGRHDPVPARLRRRPGLGVRPGDGRRDRPGAAAADR